MARAPGITFTVPLGGRAPGPEDEGQIAARSPTDPVSDSRRSTEELSVAAALLCLALVFYVVIERLRERFGAEAVAAPAATGPPAPSPGGDGD